ncbi:MAG: hypothetical protein AAGJ81_13005 [Verrucomicrobiota bacterium]
MNYAKIGIVTGVLLIAISLFGYFASEAKSFTAFIPAVAGVPILLSSLLALNPDRLKLGMHIAATFGLLGFLAPLGRIIPTAAKGEFQLNLAGGSMIAMLVVCGIFLVLCVKSFVDARRNRSAAPLE